MHAEITLVENDRLSKLARTTSIEAEPEAVITCLQLFPGFSYIMRAQYVLPYDPLLTPSNVHDRYNRYGPLQPLQGGPPQRRL